MLFLAAGDFLVGGVSGFIDLALVDGREAMPGLGPSLSMGEDGWPGNGRLFSNVAMRLVIVSAVVLAMVHGGLVGLSVYFYNNIRYNNIAFFQKHF